MRIRSTERWVFCTEWRVFSPQKAGLCTGWRDLWPGSPIELQSPSETCPGSPYQSYRQCPPIVAGVEELEGRSSRGRVVAQTKQRTVLFVILPKVHNWKKKLWPVRNPGCGGQCFLGWGKWASRPVSCLGHGWTNMRSLAEKWLWWEIVGMDSYLMIFRITQMLLFQGFRKIILKGYGNNPVQ